MQNGLCHVPCARASVEMPSSAFVVWCGLHEISACSLLIPGTSVSEARLCSDRAQHAGVSGELNWWMHNHCPLNAMHVSTKGDLSRTGDDAF
eukprot:8120200-Alexandrium_andersonii.AAC.1